MAVNKVTLNGNVLIDVSGDSVTTDKMIKGVTAHDASGAQITGSLDYSDFTGVGNTPVHGDSYTTVTLIPASDTLVGDGKAKITTMIKNDILGDASASDVKKGKTFTSQNGVKLTGTHEESSGSGSSAGLPDEITAGDTPIWSVIKYQATSSSSTSTLQLNMGKNVGFKAPKAGTYRFKFLGWTNATTGNKAAVSLSKTQNSQSSPSSGSALVYLPYSDSENLYASMDVQLNEGEKIYFFGKTASGQYGTVGAIGKVYAIEVCIDWENGTS